MSEDRWFRRHQGWILIASATLVVGGVIFFSLGSINATSQRQEIINTQVEACEHDVRFREQYRIRAIAEQKLLRLFLDLAREQVLAGVDIQTSQDFIEEFGPLTERIKILPIPNCDTLRDDLADAG